MACRFVFTRGGVISDGIFRFSVIFRVNLRKSNFLPIQIAVLSSILCAVYLAVAGHCGGVEGHEDVVDYDWDVVGRQQQHHNNL
jgi:hypothetical protein